jgi:hypothetical protein
VSTTPVPSETIAAQPSLARELLGGAIAAAIAVACLLPPLLHLVTGPLGPCIGGFVVAQRLKPETHGRAVIAATLGITLAALGAAVAFVISKLGGPDGPPDWFPTGAQIALILGGVAVYAAVLGAIGAAFGARSAGRDAR